MRRISLALALLGAVAAGCGGSGSSSSSGGAKGVQEGTFTVTVQNGQAMNGAPANSVLQIKGGVVTSTPAGINCGGAAAQECSFAFPVGTTVTLTATPNGNDPAFNNEPFKFLGFAGDCSGNTCSLTGASDKYVVAQFGGKATSHANFSAPAAHGAAVIARELTCTECHGANLQGQGIAVSCAGCHDAGLIAGVKAIQATAVGAAVEQCANCHSTGAYQAAAKHAVTGAVNVATTPVVVATNGTDLEFNVTVTVDGVPSNAFTTTSGGYRFAANPGRAAATVLNAFERVSLSLAPAVPAAPVAPALAGYQFSVAAPVNGVYKVTIVGAAGLTGNETFQIRLTDNNVDAQKRLYATAISHLNAPARDLVGDQACMNCHGDNVFRHREANGEFHHGANPQGVEACVTCHTRYGSVSRGMGGDRLTAYVHGVHASHDMPARNITANLTPPGGTSAPYTVAKAAGVYARNDGLKWNTTTNAAELNSTFSIGFPSYMGNCSICHDSSSRLTAVMGKPVSASTCFSCHDSFEGFSKTKTGGTLAATHASVVIPAAGTATANPCAACHNGTDAKATVGDYHAKRATPATTARNGLLYDGKDQSVVNAGRVVMSIDSVGFDGSTPKKLVVTWSAKLDGTAVDPCAAAVSAGVPGFIGLTANASTGQSASNLSILQAFAQGNDWVNSGNGTAPGQPFASENLTTSNTTCSGNVATSTVTFATSTATKGVVSIQGKPQILFESTKSDGSAYTRVIQVRATSPVREFLVADGSAPAAGAKRRQIVSNDKCLACHPGSLYQHGGNRVDNVELCVMCHNPAANDKNWRDSYGVTATEAYDGQAGETYDFRYMIHAIHSAGESNNPWVIYRGSNGIYAFGSEAAIAALPNWPGAGSKTVFGSTTKLDGSAQTAVTKSHNEVVVHYPRPLNDCGACHVGGSENRFGDQANQMAVTRNARTAVADASAPTSGSDNAVYGNLGDDVLMGAATASCVSCHTTPAGKAALSAHTAQWGWAPTSFEGGRQALINYVTP